MTSHLACISPVGETTRLYILHPPPQVVNRKVLREGSFERSAHWRPYMLSSSHQAVQQDDGLGGVDRNDQDVGYYRISIRGKKWYYPIFLHLIDVTIVNAWLFIECSAVFRTTHAWISYISGSNFPTLYLRSQYRRDLFPVFDDLWVMTCATMESTILLFQQSWIVVECAAIMPASSAKMWPQYSSKVLQTVPHSMIGFCYNFNFITTSWKKIIFLFLISHRRNV